MAIAEKQAPNALMDLLPMLLGEKQKTGATATSTSSANTGPLQQVFQSASQPMDQAQYDALIASIFDTAARQIPEMTTALANATGTRTSSNSGLALGLNDMNNRASQQAAQQILNYNTNQQQIAGSAARGIADSTKSTTQQQNQTQTKGTATNPLLPVVGGWALNQFDKRGGMGAVGKLASSAMGSVGDWFNPVNASSFDFGSAVNGLDSFSGDVLSNFGSEWDMAPSYADVGGATDFNFGDAGSWVGDAASGVGDWAGDAWDAVGDWGSDVWDTVSGWFADGGMPGSYGAGGYGPPCGSQLRSNYPRAGGWNGSYASGLTNPAGAPSQRMWNPTQRGGGYANGGPVGRSGPMAGGMIPARMRAPQQVADSAANGMDPNIMMQMLLRQGAAPAPVQAPEPGILNFLRYLMPTSEFNIGQFADGGMPGPRRYPAGGGYADGGVVRNRNNMGGPVQRTGVNASNRDPNAVSAMGPGGGSVNSDQLAQMMVQMQEQRAQRAAAEAEERMARLPGIASEIDPATMTIGTNAQNNAVVNGIMSSLAGLAVPGLGTALSIMGMPSLPSVMAQTIIGAVTGKPVMQNEVINPGVTVGGGIGTGGGVQGTDIGSAGPGSDSGSTGDEGAVSTGVPDQGDVTGVGIGPADGDVGDTSGAGTGTASDGDASSDAGDSSPDAGVDGGFANGGMIYGPGTGTSDSIKAKSRVPGEPSVMFSNGEMIIPRDSVEFYGPQFFQDLIMKTHGPARK